MNEPWVFWALLFACSTGALGWTAILLERQRRWERAGRIAWKARYYDALCEPDVSGSDRG